jgi:polygalacturonase
MKLISLAVVLLTTACSFGATINVLDFGAKTNDNIDDTPAVQAAIAASQRGDTVQFPPGQLDLTGVITLKGGRTYAGTAQESVLRNPAAVIGIDSARIFQLDVNDPRDVALTGLVFDGNGVRLDSAAGWPTNISIKNCTFRNSTRSANDPNAISWPHGLKNATIDHCNFTDWHGFAGVNGVGFQNVTVSYCTFDSVTAGINVVDDYEPSTTFTAIRNHVHSACSVRRSEVTAAGPATADSSGAE